MPVNVDRLVLSSLPLEQFAPTSDQSSGPASPSPQDIQANIRHGIQKAAQNFRQMVGTNTFTTTTNGTTTTIRFGDGLHGATLPSGSSGAAAYGTGSGKSGNQPTPDSALWLAIRSHTAALR